MGSSFSNSRQKIIHRENRISSKEMRIFHALCLISVVTGAPRDYSGSQTGNLDAGSLDTIAEIFGTNGKENNDGYGSGQETGALSDNVDVLVQVIKDSNNGYPDDYVPESAAQVVDKATVEVNKEFENCADYTDLLGYECVPYYQCHNGTIITDGAGLIDIRNGFASLNPEDSKCPGFLDVCCKDPDFVPPPPPQIKYSPKCGRRNNNGLGARIQGFVESESQFGEWPHMCAILHEKPVEQEAGYSGEPETVNLYQCGGSLIAPGVILTAAHCVDKFRQNRRSDVESGTPSTRLNPIPIKTEMSRISPFTRSLMEETSRTTLLFSSQMETLFLISTLTPPACQQLMRSLMEQHVSPLDGARISLELLDSTKWFSRRLTFLSSTMESVKTSSEPPDLDRSTSSMTPSCALEEFLARTPAREMEAVL